MFCCSQGYEPSSPLCAVCADGYHAQLRKCVQCEEPHVAALVLFVVGLVVAAVVAVRVVRRHAHVLTGEVVANVKVLVSFVTLVSTVGSHFGVAWPPAFLSALAAVSALAFDVSVLAGVFCIVRVSFFANLVFTTASLTAVVVVCYAIARRRPEWQAACLKVATYLLLFAYPVVSVKVRTYVCDHTRSCS